ncbi:helix-turn-helix domain-containing protein [Magnetovibrio sp. PR-2]|uniref:helix-turn-helix domain-containing protein n=1 Tax=Magnetovibrio sp. PR-2 TaxID=3120356 RepID=UPI003FA57918
MGIEHTFGKNVKALRKLAGLTQETLSHEMGVSQAYISEIESGKRKDLSIQAIGRLAKALGTTPSELMDGC